MIRFPFSSYSYPYHYYQHYTSPLQKEISNPVPPQEHTQTLPKIENRKAPSKTNPISFNFDGFTNPNQVIFEVLGIKLYLDDIIILILLFILYQEEVKDEMLFICLILLLLS